MHQSLRESAQITVMTEADVTAATELRVRLKNEFDVTYTDMLIHAASRALPRLSKPNPCCCGKTFGRCYARPAVPNPA